MKSLPSSYKEECKYSSSTKLPMRQQEQPFGKLLMGCDRRDLSNEQQHNYVLRMIFSFLDSWTLIKRAALTNREFYRTVHEGLLIAPNSKEIIEQFLPISEEKKSSNLSTLSVFEPYFKSKQGAFKSWRNTWNLTPEVQGLTSTRKIISSNMKHYDQRVEFIHVLCDVIGDENFKQVFDNCICKMLTIFLQANTKNVKYMEFESSLTIYKDIEADSPIFSTISKLFTLENYGIGLFNILEGLKLKLTSNTEIAKLFLDMIKKFSSNDHHAGQWTLKHLDLDLGTHCNSITIGDVLSYCKNILCSRNEIRENLLLESFRCSLAIKTPQDVFLLNSLFTGFQSINPNMLTSTTFQPRCNLQELSLCFDISNITDSTYSPNIETSVNTLIQMLEYLVNFTKITRLNFTIINMSMWSQLEWLCKLNDTLINLSLTCIFNKSARVKLPTENIHFNIESCRNLTIIEERQESNLFIIPNIFSKLESFKMTSTHNMSIISKLVAPSLQSLTLCGIVIPSIPFEPNVWACCSKVKQIHISQSAIHSTEQFFKNLGNNAESIICEDSTFNSYPKFESFKNLKYLKFPNIDGNFDCLSIVDLKKLEVFVLKSVPQQRVLNVQCIEDLENLILLDLAGCNRFVFNQNSTTRETCELSSLDISNLKKLEFLNMDNVPIITQNFSIHPSWAKQMHKLWIEIKSLISHPIEMDNYKINDSALTSIFQNNQKTKYVPEISNKKYLLFGLDFKIISDKILEYLREKADFMDMAYRQGFFNRLPNHGEVIVGTLTIDHMFKTKDVLSLIYTFRFYKSNQIMVGSIKFSHHEGQDVTFWSAFDRTLSKSRKNTELYKSVVGGLYSTAVLQKELLEQTDIEEETSSTIMENNTGFGKSDIVTATNEDNQSCLLM